MRRFLVPHRSAIRSDMSRHSHTVLDPEPRPQDGPEAPPAVSSRDEQGNELDLAEYARVLWQRRWSIASAALVCGSLLAGWSFLAPRQFEAAATLAVAASKLGSDTSRQVTTGDFLPLVRSRTVAAQVIAELRLHEPPHLLSTTDFIEKVLRVEDLRTTSLIELRVTLNDPALAARAANAVARRAIELSRKLNQDEAVQARDYIKEQLDEARVRREQAATALEDFRKTAQIELLREDLEAMLDARGGLLQLQVDTEAERARLGRSEQELAGQERTGSVLRSIDSNPTMLEGAREAGASPGDALRLQMREEYVNRVFDRLTEDVAETRASLAALEKRQTQLLAGKKIGARRLPELDDLYSREMMLNRLQLDYDLANKVYTEVATQYEGSRLQVAGRSAQLQIIDSALPPDRPMSRKVARNGVAGAMLGGGAAALGIVLLYAIRSLNEAPRRRRAD